MLDRSSTSQRSTPRSPIKSLFDFEFPEDAVLRLPDIPHIPEGAMLRTVIRRYDFVEGVPRPLVTAGDLGWTQLG